MNARAAGDARARLSVGFVSVYVVLREEFVYDDVVLINLFKIVDDELRVIGEWM